MSLNCPNINSKEWKSLVKQSGETLANMAFVANGYEIPNVRPLTEIKKAIGFKTNVENFASIASKLIRYNKKNGTAHSFSKKNIYGNTFKLTFQPNYLPVNIEKQRRRMESRNADFRIEGEANKAFDNIYTPSLSEQASGYMDENGDFQANANKNEDIDYLIPDSRDEIIAVEKIRRRK